MPRYQVAICLKGRIADVDGPYEAGLYLDVKIFCLNLRRKLKGDKRVITEKGYVNKKCLRPQQLHGTNKNIERYLIARQESVNGRIKTFACLGSIFRHSPYKQAYCFLAVASLVNMKLRKRTTFK